MKMVIGMGYELDNNNDDDDDKSKINMDMK